MNNSAGNHTSSTFKTTRTRVRNWTFTLNNWTAEEFELIKKTECRWLIVGRELGETGTPHLQGAIVFINPRTLHGVKATSGFNRCHLEIMRGSCCANRIYCTKEDIAAHETGICPAQGKRTDIHALADRITGGESLRDLVKDTDGAVGIVKFHKGLTILRSLSTPPRTEPPVVLWLHGETGTGKTKCAVFFAEQHVGADYWISSGGLTWFDGYDGQHIAILDDYRANHCRFSLLLRILDRYRFDAPFKGGFVRWQPKLIIITAPATPELVWASRTREQLEQLTRRISAVILFEPLGTPGRDDHPDLSRFYPAASAPTAMAEEDVIDLTQESESEDLSQTSLRDRLGHRDLGHNQK